MDVIKRLIDFDRALSLIKSIDDKLEILIVGGSALYLHKVLGRQTYDIDAFFRLQT